MTWIRIWIDEGQRHSKLNRELEEDRNEMRKLGINIDQVESEFIESLKHKPKALVEGEEAPN